MDKDERQSSLSRRSSTGAVMLRLGHRGTVWIHVGVHVHMDAADACAFGSLQQGHDQTSSIVNGSDIIGPDRCMEARGRFYRKR
jgi:hypothetical protein